MRHDSAYYAFKACVSLYAIIPGTAIDKPHYSRPLRFLDYMVMFQVVYALIVLVSERRV